MVWTGTEQPLPRLHVQSKTDDGASHQLHPTLVTSQTVRETKKVRGCDREGLPRFKNVKFEDCWQNWERTIPMFLMPDAGEPWVFYGPSELQFDSILGMVTTRIHSVLMIRGGVPSPASCIHKRSNI